MGLRGHGYLAFVSLASCNIMTSVDEFSIAASVDCPNGCPDSGSSCPSVPAGWTLVNVVDDTATCAPGAARTLLENPRAGTAPCTCNCGGPSDNPCEQLSGGMQPCSYAVNDGPCTGKCSVVAQGCNVVDNWSPATTSLAGTPKSPATQSCPATAALPSIASDSTIDVCVVSEPSAACRANSCVIREGADTPCPPAFERRRLMTDKTKLDDSRSCATCSCTTKATACVDASLTFYAGNSCTGEARAVVFDSACHAVEDVNFSPTSYWYHASPSPAGCAPSEVTVTMTGTVGSKAQTTVCCRPQ